MGFRSIRAWTVAVAGCALPAFAKAGVAPRPAAREHVRYIDGVPMRFVSKLSHVVELNFNLFFNHVDGRSAIRAYLDSIAADYSPGSGPAFTIKRFIGPGNGGAMGLPTTPFTLDDLRAADVIVANNLSGLSNLFTQGPTMAAAFEQAVREGKSVLGFHASGDFGRSDWTFLQEEFFPLRYIASQDQSTAPVYRDDAEGRHLVLQGVLEKGTEPMEVPMGTDPEGREMLKAGVPARAMKNEWYRFGANLLADPRLAPMTTCLMRYDPRGLLSDAAFAPFRYAGGNAYSFILKVGPGKSAYIPAGHDNSELTIGKGFDGGTGDFERYYAQMLFFLAGYDSAPCGESIECDGLPIVDSRDHLTGGTYGRSISIFDPRRMPAAHRPGTPYRAVLADPRGRIVKRYGGPEGAPFTEGGREPGPGVYFLKVEGEKGRSEVRRLLVPPEPR